MARSISFALTTPQFLDGSKTVTRRKGWEFLEAGDTLCAVKQSQGIPKGGKVKKLGMIRVTDTRREPLRRMTDAPGYGQIECRREGFPDMTPAEFVQFFCCSHKKVTPDTIITRIEFERIAAVGDPSHPSAGKTVA